MSKKIFFRYMLTIYSILIDFLLGPLLNFFGRWLPAVRRQLHDRGLTSDRLNALKKLRQTQPNSVTIFCSSAGEYEQARPIIDRLTSHQNYLVHVLIFSQSGMEFINSSDQPPMVEFDLAPLDSVFQWQRYFSAWSPTHTIVVRHEIWPGFLWTAQKTSRLILINASFKKNHSTHLAKKYLLRTLLSFFDQIHVVSEQDLLTGNKILMSHRDKLILTGDTKYDRVLERSSARIELRDNLNNKIADSLGDCKRFVMGSCWPADLDVFLPGYTQFCNKLKSCSSLPWKLLIAPHDLSAANLERIEKSLSEANLSFLRWSKSLTHSSATLDAIIFDEMGYLAELYGCAQAAMVGGACHHKIHNILEPAAYNIPIIHGPFYSSQTEAVLFVDQGQSLVVQTPDEVLKVLSQFEEGRNIPTPLEALKHLSGAADRIMASLSVS